MAGAKDARFRVLLGWAEAPRELKAPTIIPEPSDEAGIEAPSVVDNTPCDNGVEAWRRLVQRFDLASAHANLDSMSKILKARKGKIENMSFPIEQNGR